jgi:hypothetical protein
MHALFSSVNKKNAEFAEPPEPWAELVNKDEELLIRCGFLHIALAGTISKAHATR